MKKMILRLILFSVAIVICIYFIYRIFANISLSDHFGSNYTHEDAINNYYKNEDAIFDLIKFFSSVTPDPNTNKGVVFSLNKVNRFDIGLYLLDGSVLENKPNIGGSNLKFNTKKTDSLLAVLNWDNTVVKVLIQKLKNANCISIRTYNIESFMIDVGYSKWGMFSYQIFRNSISSDLVEKFNKMGHTVLNNNVVVKYSGAL